MEDRSSILLIDDDESTRRSLTLVFNKSGYNVESVGTGQEAVERVREKFFNLALVDIKLPDMEGTKLIAPLKELRPDMEIIMVTAHASLETAMHAMNEGTAGYIVKPLRMNDVLSRLEQVIDKQALVLENRRLVKALEQELADRNQAESEREAAYTLLQTTIDGIDEAIMVIGLDYRVRLMNRTVREHYIGPGRDQQSWRCHEVFHHRKEPCEEVDYICPLLQVRETLQPITVLQEHQRWDGETRVHETVASPVFEKQGTLIGIVQSSRDVTERKSMEEELKKIEKLESLGVLAGGIAHDFNNILTAILGNISLAKIGIDADEEIYEILTEAEMGAVRAKDLTQQLLTFSKGGAPVKEVVSIGGIIKECCSFTLRGARTRCDFSIADDLWDIEADVGQMNQVINNLILNADQAMQNGGVISVHAENVSADRTFEGSPLDAGQYIRISIQDQGIGIPEENLSRIFDPFFTTKRQGNGLGLASAYSIVKKHSGHITVESQPGRGTSFHVYLPATGGKAYRSAEKRLEMVVGHGRILVMDDEETVRKVAGNMLKGIGYEVEYARDGEEAIELYKEAKEKEEPFDAVIMDLTIPAGMGGREAMRKLIQIDPKARGIVSSGYSTDPVMSDFKKFGFRGVAVKPYRYEELGRTLYEIVNSRD